jgi:hypothetical protein
VSRVADLGRFLYEFVVGDDWRVAVGVVAGLGLTALAAEAGYGAYLVLPLLVIVLLGWSLWRALPPQRD